MHVIKAAGLYGDVEDRMVGYKCWLSERSVPSLVFVLLTWYRWYNSFWSATATNSRDGNGLYHSTMNNNNENKSYILMWMVSAWMAMAWSQEVRPWSSVPCVGFQSDRQGWSWLCCTVTRRTIQMCCLFLCEQFLVPIKRDCHYFCGTSFGAERGSSGGHTDTRNDLSISGSIHHKSKYHNIITTSSFHQIDEAMRIEKWVWSMIGSFSSVPKLQSGLRKSNKIKLKLDVVSF